MLLFPESIPRCMEISHRSNGKADYMEGKTRLTLIRFDCR